MKKIIFVLTALIAFAAAGNLSAQTVNDVNVKYNEAAELVAAKKYAEAIPALEAVINMGIEVGGEAANTVTLAQKALPACYFQQGLSMARTGKLDDALAMVDKTIEAGELYGVPNSVRQARQLGAQVYMQQGATPFNNKDYKKAIESFTKGYEMDPNFTQNVMLLAEAYCEDGNMEKGFEIYDEVIALGERSSRYKAAADEAYQKKLSYLTAQASDVAKKGNRSEAYGLFEEIFKLDPNNAYAQMTRVQVATNAEDWANVIRWAPAAAEAQTTDANKSEIYFLQAAAYQNTERVNEAVATYRKVTAGNKVSSAKAQIEALLNPPTK